MNKPSGNFRWVICGLLFFSVLVNYLNQLTVSMLKGPLSEMFGWSNADYGYITGAFSFAYAFGYLFGGRLTDRWGVGKALPYFVGIWSLSAVLHGLVVFLDRDGTIRALAPKISTGFPFLVISVVTVPMTAAGFIYGRIVLGLCQGGNFPAAIRAVAEWFPPKERAMALGWFNSGTSVGAMLCPLLVGFLFNRLGFQLTFYITGGIGFLWVIAWKSFYRDPVQSGRQSAENEDSKRVSWVRLLGYRASWACIIPSVLIGPVWGFYKFFIPDFLQKKFNLSLAETGVWTSVFFAVALGGGVAGGWFSGKLMALGWSLNRARKTALLVCALCVVPVFFAPYVPAVWMAVLIVGIAGFAHQGWSANGYSVVADTVPKEAVSSVVGLGGFVAFMTSGFVNIITGSILDKTGSYVLIFAYFSGMYLLSLLAIQLLVPRIGASAS